MSSLISFRVRLTMSSHPRAGMSDGRAASPPSASCPRLAVALARHRPRSPGLHAGHAGFALLAPTLTAGRSRRPPRRSGWAGPARARARWAAPPGVRRNQLGDRPGDRNAADRVPLAPDHQGGHGQPAELVGPHAGTTPPPEGDIRANGEINAWNSAMAARSVTGSRGGHQQVDQVRVPGKRPHPRSSRTAAPTSGWVAPTVTPAAPARGADHPDGERAAGPRQRGHAQQHQPLDPVRVGQRVPQRPHPAPRVAEQRGGVQLEGVEEPVQPGDRALAVAGWGGRPGRSAPPRAGRGRSRGPHGAPAAAAAGTRRVPGAVEERPAAPPCSRRWTRLPASISTWRLRTGAPASRRSYTWRISAEWGCRVRACGRLLIGASSGACVWAGR